MEGGAHAGMPGHSLQPALQHVYPAPRSAVWGYRSQCPGLRGGWESVPHPGEAGLPRKLYGVK